MQNEAQPLLENFDALWQSFDTLLSGLLLYRGRVQIAILIGCPDLAWGLGRLLAPHSRRWMHSLEGWNKSRLRFLVVVHRRLRLIIFVLLSWAATWIMSLLFAFPSWHTPPRLAATISTALLAVAFVARLVRNGLFRRLFTWGLWIYVTLYYLGLLEPVTTSLDHLSVRFGDFRLSALAVIKALIVTTFLFGAARLISSAVSERIRRATDLSPSFRVLTIKVVQITLYSSTFFIGLKAAGFDLTGLAVLSGAIGVGLGFGLQKVVSNLVSGIIILLDKSIKPADVISLGDAFGWINSLGARYVSVVTRDGREYLIPNEDLITGQVVNWSHSDDFVRLDIRFGISYADNPHDVRRIAIQAASNVDRVLQTRPPVCHITGFGDSAVDYELRFWISDPTGGLTNIRGNVYLALWYAFHEHGISIPFPQREVRLLGTGPEGEAPA